MLIQKTVAKDGSKAFSLILCKLNLTRKEPETKVREAKLAKAKFTGKHANKGREVQHLPRFDLGKLCPWLGKSGKVCEQHLTKVELPEELWPFVWSMSCCWAVVGVPNTCKRITKGLLLATKGLDKEDIPGVKVVTLRSSVDWRFGLRKRSWQLLLTWMERKISKAKNKQDEAARGETGTPSKDLNFEDGLAKSKTFWCPSLKSAFFFGSQLAEVKTSRWSQQHGCITGYIRVPMEEESCEIGRQRMSLCMQFFKCGGKLSRSDMDGTRRKWTSTRVPWAQCKGKMQMSHFVTDQEELEEQHLIAWAFFGTPHSWGPQCEIVYRNKIEPLRADIMEPKRKNQPWNIRGYQKDNPKESCYAYCIILHSSWRRKNVLQYRALAENAEEMAGLRIWSSWGGKAIGICSKYRPDITWFSGRSRRWRYGKTGWKDREEQRSSFTRQKDS